MLHKLFIMPHSHCIHRATEVVHLGICVFIQSPPKESIHLRQMQVLKI